MDKLLRIMVLGVVFCVSPAAFADYEHEDDPESPMYFLGEAVAYGNGCPSGTFQIQEGIDGTEITILFSAFTAETEPGRTVDWANCNVALPIHVPDGLSVGLIGVDYRGLARITGGSYGYLTREYFFAGARGPREVDYIRGDFFGEFFYEDDVAVVAWSRCGDDVIARSNATVVVRKSWPYTFEESFMSVFSEDWDVSIVFHLRWRSC